MSRLGVTGLRGRIGCRNFASQRPGPVKNARRTTSYPSLKLPKLRAHCWRADSGVSRKNAGEKEENRKRYSRPHVPMTRVDTSCGTAPTMREDACACVSCCLGTCLNATSFFIDYRHPAQFMQTNRLPSHFSHTHRAPWRTSVPILLSTCSLWRWSLKTSKPLVRVQARPPPTRRSWHVRDGSGTVAVAARSSTENSDP